MCKGILNQKKNKEKTLAFFFFFFFLIVQCVLLETDHSLLGAVWFEGKNHDLQAESVLQMNMNTTLASELQRLQVFWVAAQNIHHTGAKSQVCTSGERIYIHKKAPWI